ncbi:MAG: glycosyltransferase family 2 protein, partial [Muribaculaceae bacterium]|nr:glycosyltransferase family 2 protein [Muribaculaceae bacterium]
MSTPDRQTVIATMRSMKVCVIVPTYNNGGTIGRVLDDILGYADDVIVVNDGSTDGTADILRSFGDRITVVSYERNRGKGHALKTGFAKARTMGYDYAITIDSDGQHYASDIPLFVRAIAEHPGALIVGQRDLSNVDINGKSSLANKFSNFWFYVQTGRRLPDTQTGYR